MCMAALKMGLLDISFGCLIITMHMCICLPAVALIFCVLPTLCTLHILLLNNHFIAQFLIYSDCFKVSHSFLGVCNLFKKLKILLLSQ